MRMDGWTHGYIVKVEARRMDGLCGSGLFLGCPVAYSFTLLASGLLQDHHEAQKSICFFPRGCSTALYLAGSKHIGAQTTT